MRLLPPDPPEHCADQPLPAAPHRGSGARIWLVRHAQVDPAWQGFAYGNGDVPLSKEGRARSQALARAFRGLGIARVHSSPLVRALELGQSIARECAVELKIDARLAEIDRGAWQGLPLADYQARWHERAREYWADPLHWKGHGGESEAELRARTWAALEESLGEGDCVLTIHYQVLRALVASALGLAPARSHALTNDPGFASLLIDSPRGWNLARVNVDPPERGPLSP